MLRSQDLPILKEYRRYRPTKRFYKIILAIILIIIFAILLDKLPKPESYFTSVYWRG